MISGKTITIHRPTIEYDADHDAVKTYVDEIVNNVVIAPGSTADITADPHVDGIKIAYTLGMPKTWSFHSLKDCLITLPAPWNYTGKVIGDPMPNDIDNCPTSWYCTAQLEAYDG